MKTKMKEGWMPKKQTILDMLSTCPGVDVRYEKDKFVDYYLSNGGMSANWEAAFRNWIRRADEYRKQKEIRTGHSATSTGEVQDRRNRILTVAKSGDRESVGNKKRVSNK
jgi:hypothetical protein